jgi:low affinity Fe/Cu permease
VAAGSKQTRTTKNFFYSFARWSDQQLARPAAFTTALFAVVLWACSGPLLSWNDTWQLVINTVSSVVTLLMVFVIQHTQRRDTDAIQLKLDELIRVNKEARNELISLEAKPDTEVEELRSMFGE